MALISAMKRIRNFFRKSRDVAGPETQEEGSFTLEAPSFASRIYQRPASEPVVYFRTALSPAERRVLEDLPSALFEGAEPSWQVWLTCVTHLSSSNSVNADPDHVSRVLLIERTALLLRLQSRLHLCPTPPSALLKFLLITLSDHLNIAKFTSSLGSVDPFTSATYTTEVQDLVTVLTGLLPLLQGFIQKDRSGLLLHRKALEMMVDFLQVMGQKAGKMEGCSEEKATPFLWLLASCSECVCLQSELIRLHLKSHKGLDSHLLQQHFNALYTCISSLHTSSATEKLVWQAIPPSSESILPADAQGRNLLLVLLTSLYAISLENDNFQDHVTKFLRKRILTTLTLRLRTSRGLEEPSARPCLYIFLTALQILRLHIRTARTTILLVLEEGHAALSELLSIACWYHFHWSITVAHPSFTQDQSFLARIYQELSVIAEAAVKTKVESHFFSLFSQLTDASLYEQSQGRLPIVQSYTLELLSDYVMLLFKSGCEVTEGGLIDAYAIILSPLFTSVLEETPMSADYEMIGSVSAEELLPVVRRSFYGLLNQLRRFREGTKGLVFAFTTCLHQYKELKGFIGKVTTVLRELLEHGDEGLMDCLIQNNAIECVFQLLYDCRLYEACRDSLRECTQMLLTFLSLPALCAHVLSHCGEMSERVMTDFLPVPHLADFSISYALRLMQEPGSLLIANQFVAAFASSADPTLTSKLTISLEHTLLTCPSPLLRTTLTDAKLLDVLFSRLQALDSPDNVLILLSILRLVLCDTPYAQEKLRLKSYLSLQSLLQVLYFEVTPTQKRYDVTYLDHFEGLMEVLFDMLVGREDSRDIAIPDLLPVILNLLQALYNAEMKKVFLQRLLALISFSAKNRYVASLHGVTEILLEALRFKPNSELKELLVCILTAIGTFRFTAANLQSAIHVISEDSAAGHISETSVKVLSLLRRCYQDSIQQICEEREKRLERWDVKPRSFFIFSGGDCSIQAELDHLVEEFRAVALWMWVKPGRVAGSMLSFEAESGVRTLTVRVEEAGSCSVVLGLEPAVQVLGNAGCLLSQEKWSHFALVCVPVKGNKRKFDLFVYINGKEAVKSSTELLSRVSFYRFKLGTASDGKGFTGLVSHVYLANTAIDSADVGELMKLGPNYDGQFLRIESRWSEYFSVGMDRYQQVLHPYLELVLNPKLLVGETGAKGEGQGELEDMASFAEGSAEADRTGERRRPPPNPQSRLVSQRSVIVCVTTRLPDSLRSLGGPVQLFPLLRRQGTSEWYLAAIDEFLQICTYYCRVPSMNVVRDITSGSFCEMLTYLLEEVSCDYSLTENIVGSVIYILQNLSWSSMAQPKAFEKLLLNFKVWRHQDWGLKKPIVITITQYIKDHPRKDEVKFLIETVLMLLERNFSLQRSKNKEARKEIMDLLENNLVGPKDYSEEVVKPVLDWAAYAAHLHPGNAGVYLGFFGRLLDRGKFPTDAKTRTALRHTLGIILSKSSKHPEITVQALDILFKQIAGRALSDTSESSLHLLTDPDLCAMLESVLPSELSLEVYRALVPFCVQEGRGRKTRTLEGLYMPGVLDIVGAKLGRGQELQGVLTDLQEICRALGLAIAERTRWQRWLPHLLEVASDLPCEGLSIDIASEVLSAALLSVEGAGLLLRTVVQETDQRLGTEKALEVLKHTLVKCCARDLSAQSKLAILNFHELAYFLEDLSASAALPCFAQVFSSFLDLAQRLALLFSSYPPLPVLSFDELLQVYGDYPNVELMHSGSSRKREGGIVRICIQSLLLVLKSAQNEASLHVAESALAGLLSKMTETAIETATSKVRGKIGTADSSLCYAVVPDMAKREENVFTAKFLTLMAVAELAFAGDRFEVLMERLVELLGGKKALLDRFSQLPPKRLKQILDLFKEFPQAFKPIFPCNSADSGLKQSLDSLQAGLETALFRYKEMPRASPMPAPLCWLLLGETSTSISVIQHALAFYQKTSQWVQRGSQEEVDRVWSDIDQQAKALISSYDQRILLISEAEEVEKALARRRVNRLLKRAGEKTGLWTEPEAENVYWKIDPTVDGEMKRTYLLVNKEGHAHMEAVNKKYKPKLQDEPVPIVAEMREESDIESERVRVLKTFAVKGGEFAEALDPATDQPELETEGIDEENMSMSDEALSQHRRSFPSDYDLVDYESPQDMLRTECERISLKGAVFGTLEITAKCLLFRSTGEMKPGGRYPGSALPWMCVQKQGEKIWELSEIHEVLGRRFMQRHTAFELFTYTGTSAYFNCFTEDNQGKVLSFLKARQISDLQVYEAPASHFAKLHYVHAWKRGELTNFEYLMLLNKFASRSFNDISQYPVFPWVLSDYSSQVLNLGAEETYRDLGSPVGALEPKCRADAMRKYEEWIADTGIDAFHYGSHYSTGGIVMYYLVRLEPFSTLAIQLQDKHFDVADRLFWSIESAWNGTLRNSGDYKELIPEFFSLPEFLLNLNHYHFGCRQTLSTPVDAVELPAWAGGSVYNFVRLHREALESPIVSENLHKWIDLIFGVKQYGEEAKKAVNVFFHVTYERNIKRLFENGAISDPNFSGILDQIAHYGQTPSQIFTTAHPKRTSPLRPLKATDKFFSEGYRIEAPALAESEDSGPFPYIAMLCAKAKLVLVKTNRTVKTLKWRNSASDVFGRSELSAPEDIVLAKVSPKYMGSRLRWTHFVVMYPYLFSGLHHDYSFKIHNLDSGALERAIYHHDGLVTALGLCLRTVTHKSDSHQAGLLATGSEDLTIALWEVRSHDPFIVAGASPMKILRGHQAEVKQCCVDEGRRMVVSVDMDGGVLLHQYQADRTRVIRPPGTDLVDSIALSKHGLIAVAWTSARSHISLFSINSTELWTFPCPYKAHHLDFNASSDHLLLSGEGGLRALNVFAQPPKSLKCLDKVKITCSGFAPEERSLLALVEGAVVRRVDCVSKQAKKEIAERMRIVGFPCD